MAATPKTGVVTFVGIRSGNVYNVPLYNADVAGTYCRLDNGTGTPGATGGSDVWIPPEDCKLVDASFVTGIVDTQNLRIMADYKPTPYILNWPNHVNTLATRTPINVGFAKGTRVSFLQLA